MIFALAGSGIDIDPVLRVALSALLLMVSGIIGIALFQLYRKRHGA